MRRRSPILAFLLVAAALPTGCGNDDGDVEQITKLTRQFAADVKGKDWKGACGAMSAKAKAEILAGAEFVGASGCPDVIAKLYALDDSPEVLGTVNGADVTITDVKVRADRATAQVTPTFAGSTPTTRYVREDGHWKLDSGSGADAG